jgi:hypothetical protein
MTNFNKRFTSKIPWVPFRNDSGQTIPPYSVISAAQWYGPNIDNPIGGSTLSPFFSALPPGNQNRYSTNPTPINPYTLYLTGRESTNPASGQGPNGMAAQPLFIPMLASIASLYTSTGQATAGETCGPLPGSLNPFAMTLDAPAFIIAGFSSNSQYVFVQTYTGLYRGNLPANSGNTTGLIQVTTFVEPAGTPSNITYPVCNPYGNVITGQGINPRCTYGWVGGQWELVAADPCPDVFASCSYQSVYGNPPGSGGGR